MSPRTALRREPVDVIVHADGSDSRGCHVRPGHISARHLERAAVRDFGRPMEDASAGMISAEPVAAHGATTISSASRRARGAGRTQMTDEEKTIRLTKFPVLLLLGNAITFFVVAMWALLTPAHAVCECWDSFHSSGRCGEKMREPGVESNVFLRCPITVGRYLATGMGRLLLRFAISNLDVIRTRRTDR